MSKRKSPRRNPSEPAQCWSTGKTVAAGAAVFVAGMAVQHVLILPLVARFAPQLLSTTPPATTTPPTT